MPLKDDLNELGEIVQEFNDVGSTVTVKDGSANNNDECLSLLREKAQGMKLILGGLRELMKAVTEIRKDEELLASTITEAEGKIKELDILVNRIKTKEDDNLPPNIQ